MNETMLNLGVFLFWFGIWLVFPWLATLVGNPKRGALNVFLGLLLGPIGVLIAAVVGLNREPSRD